MILETKKLSEGVKDQLAIKVRPQTAVAGNKIIQSAERNLNANEVASTVFGKSNVPDKREENSSGHESGQAQKSGQSNKNDRDVKEAYLEDHVKESLMDLKEVLSNDHKEEQKDLIPHSSENTLLI